MTDYRNSWFWERWLEAMRPADAPRRRYFHIDPAVPDGDVSVEAEFRGGKVERIVSVTYGGRQSGKSARATAPTMTPSQIAAGLTAEERRYFEDGEAAISALCLMDLYDKGLVDRLTASFGEPRGRVEATPLGRAVAAALQEQKT